MRFSERRFGLTGPSGGGVRWRALVTGAIAGLMFLAAGPAGVLGQEADQEVAQQAGQEAAQQADQAADPLPDRDRWITRVRGFDDLVAAAEALSEQPHRGGEPLPPALAAMNYDDYIKIRYRAPRATWFDQDLPFWLETFHRGFVQTDRVDLFTLNPIDGASPVSQRIAFSKDDFLYADAATADAIPAAGHAGVRIVGRFPGRDDPQEMLSFVGSSYFRGRSADTVYGSSTRGLAVNIAMNRSEEFPDFTAFWIVRPEIDDDAIEILALLESPSVCGAYRFEFQPGLASSTQHVDAKLFFREVPDKVAIAPLTSMWIWGDGLKGPPLDKRPAVHDADGLLVRGDDDQWRWRAFARQAYPSVTSSRVDRLLGFGVIQRNRAFYHYDDHNAHYHLRPSVWITPDQPWTDGRIELLELPGAHEGVDNIAAYWVADRPPVVGTAYEIAYQVEYFAGDPDQHDRLGRATNLAVRRDPSSPQIELEIRFAGPILAALGDQDRPEMRLAAIRGTAADASLNRTETGDWIATFAVTPNPGEAEDAPVELSLTLVRQGRAVSEEFTYLLPPREPQFMYPQVYTRQE